MRENHIHCVFIVVFAKLIYCSEPKVTLKIGSVIGLSEHISGKNMNVFLGIPYAKPPINELRFRKPQPLIEKWQTTVQAKQWPNECIQRSEYPVFATRSEDCLFLNIWSPVDLKSNFSNNLKPVMFWIYGGAFVTGSISDRVYNASILSAIGDVVVVTVNYRVGPLGFMFGGRDEMPGNMGLYDQQMALEWVQENIAYFGGDKNLVTLFGESAGSMSVLFHLMSPSSKSLYKNAIAMSGTATDYLLTDSKFRATKIRNLFAKFLGCETNDDEVISESTLNCLRKIDAERFASKDIIEEDSKNGNLLGFPVYGEAFIPKRPEELLKDTQFKEHTKLLFGLLPNEGMIMQYEFAAIWDSNKTGEELMREHLEKQFYSESISLTQEDIDEIIKFYFSGVQVEKQRDIYLTALGDLYFNCPMLQFASHFSQSNVVHQYLLDFKAKYKLMEIYNDCETCKPEVLSHADDVPFTFGTSPYKDDTQITLRWIKIITDFAKTGTNNWPAFYTTKYGNLITKYYHIKNTDEESEVRVGYRQVACQLWSAILNRKKPFTKSASDSITWSLSICFIQLLFSTASNKFLY